ncbi:hypothetical protein EVAR_39898_1 [Eumeta japonica]|uniref:Uncharacterized protein n=1 Tax=Eumeta variegata TaxID=151549 RepID=A0A4C1WQ28_EUMVA|nr:hypothetical protein EVAR_39898_1 [Eumeta japonica]
MVPQGIKVKTGNTSGDGSAVKNAAFGYEAPHSLQCADIRVSQTVSALRLITFSRHRRRSPTPRHSVYLFPQRLRERETITAEEALQAFRCCISRNPKTAKTIQIGLETHTWGADGAVRQIDLEQLRLKLTPQLVPQCTRPL